MKKPTNLRLILIALIFFQSYFVISQNLKSFSPRFDKRLKGDMLLIGNNILNRETNNRSPKDAYNGAGYNSDFTMKYIDVDSDNTTFSSSSATLTVPKPACYKIVYAGLYWGAILQQNDRTDIEKVKLKLPTGGYNDITGQIIHDASAAPIGGDNNKAYACYADITSLVAGQTNAQGLYTVANVKSSEGTNGGTGLSAGWSIFVVYEDPTLPAKFITSFDGFSGIGGATTLDIAVSGFKTIPTGPVRVKFAFAALEGDQPISGDYLEINSTRITATNAANVIIRPSNNFFNSSVTYVDPATDKTEDFLNRNPASTNTLGYDAGILNINNPGTLLRPGGIVIDNNETSANIRLGSTQDVYFYYFNAFAVDIIEPHIVLTKIVKNSAGVDIGNQDVTLGQQLNYEIGFKNTGNDDAKSLTIRDQLPINIIFNYPTDINPLPAGVSIQSYNPATRSIVFKIDDSVVKANTLTDKVISFKVKVVPDCNSLSEACSNSIDNSAYATYKGTLNPDFQISDDPSVNTNTGCILTPKATNFLVGVDGCKYTATATLCKDDVDLVAANGYTSYTWYSDEARTKQIGTGQILKVKDPGVYYVYNLAAAPCRSIYQAFTVTRFGTTTTNPVLPYAKAPYKGEVLICPNNGKELPNLFLCGANDSRLIETHVSDGSTLVWEKLDEASCAAPISASCANEGTSCSWTQVATGPNYEAKIAGQYRLTLNYAGGCFNRFYFNVFTNSLNPTEKHTDIICGKPGTITVGGVPAGYEYSINGTTYQASNIFNVTTAGFYTVYIRLTGVTGNTCIFTVPNIQIRQRNFAVVSEVTQPLCYGEKGKIKVAVNDANAQYYYKLYNNGLLLSNVGPVPESEYTFDNLTTDQNYVVEVSTDDGCKDTKYIYVGKVWNEFKATVALIEPLTACSTGKIRITTEGGNSPYNYFINSDTVFQLENEFVVTTPGVYNIKIVDKNNCTITRTITVADNAKPTYTIDHTNSTCYNDNSQIKINLINANGYSMSYSINNGGTYVTNPVFSNLQAGTYNVIVRYGMTYTPLNGQPTVKYCMDTAVKVVITGPTSAVTASAGVAELAGCTLAGLGGKLRINNAQGGTAPYQYSFDGGANWQNLNEKDVLPGSYILKIRDALGCEYTIPYNIILDQKPADPTIKVEDPIFSCNGSASTTVTVTNGTSNNYTYEYYIDGVANTPITNNVFTNVTSGTHTISVKYNVTTVSTYSNLLQEDFGKGGYTTTPGISPVYCFEDESTPHPTSWSPLCGSITDYQINDGKYAVASSIKTNFGNTWIVAKDHTTPSDPLGRFLCVNIGSSAGVGGIIYSKPIKDVIVNQPVIISLWAENLMKSTTGASYFDPELTIQLVNNLNGVGGTETIVATTDTANPWRVPRNEKWEYKELSLNPGAYNNLSFVIRSYNTKFSGNDLLVDDIWVRQIPKSCIAQKDFKVIVDSNKAFTVSEPIIDNASCSDITDGRITVAVSNFDTVKGFQYSINGGTTWTTSMTSPVIITGLAAGSYKVIVKSDDAGTCSKSFDKIIGAPTAVTTTATMTTPPTCTTGASITAVAKGGKPNYQYELRLADGITVVVAFQNLAVFTNVPAGTYKVVVKDQGPCSSPASDVVTIVAPTAPTASLDLVNSDLCYDAANKATLVVTVTGGKAPYNYSLDGQPSQTTNKFINVAPGTHNIVVTDANNCTATAITGIIIAPELTAVPEVTKIIDCTTSPDAEITITASQGTAPYTYEVSSNGGTTYTSMPTNIYKTSTAGNYVFKVTDAKGCSVVTAAATVNAKVNPTATVDSKDPSCNNGTNGQFTVIPAGGAGAPYTYSFNGSTTFVSGATLTGLDAFVGAVNTKNYTYQVKDSKGCLSPVYTVTLNNPTKVVASATFTPNTTCSTTTLITSAGAGGAGGYTYNFDGSTNYTATNTLLVTNKNVIQTITYSVKDAKGCIDTKTIDVPAFNPPTALNFSAPAAITCNTTTASTTVTTVGGVAPFTYIITAGPGAGATNTTGLFTGLVAGNYSFKVTDANGCTTTGSIVINPSPTITVAGSKTDELCVSANDGTATFTVSGASTTGNFTYTLTPNAGTVSVTADIVKVTGLTAGTYTLVVKDKSTGCTSNTASVTIVAATAITFNVNGSKISCNDKISTLTITGLSGGTPGYTYAYAASGSTVPSTPYGTTLTVDTAVLTTNIDVYVKDNNGCTTKKTVAISSEAVPTIDPIAAQCYTGTPINVTITGTYTGTATFSKDGTNYVSSPTFSLTPGTYTLSLKDKFGCPASITYVVAPQLTIGTDIVDDTSCTPNTTITLSSTGGTGAHTYQVSYNSGAFVTAANPYIATATGTYQFRVTDSKTPAPACTALSSVINVTLKSTVLAITTSKVDVKCNGGGTGSILVTPTSGKAPFTYTITKTTAPGLGTVYTVNNPSGLFQGTYSILVTDALGCTSAAASVTINEPTQLVATAHADPFKCNAANTKQSTLVIIDLPTTGTAPYTYSFNGGSYTPANTLTVTDNGLNQIVKYSVTDANGCTTAVQQLTINKLDPPKITSVSATAIYCDPVASRTSTATIVKTGGVGLVTYEIVSGPIINTTGLNSGIFTGLTTGTYVFKAIDESGCYDTFSKSIPPVTSITALATKLNDVYCFGGSTGNIRYNVSGFTSTYSYTINGGTAVTGQTAGTFTLPNLAKGIYSVVFTDETTLCTVPTSITITEPTAAVSATVAKVNANCIVTTSKVTVTASGGTPGYTYAYMQNNVAPADSDYIPSATANLNPATNTDWDIWVKDANGCPFKVDVTISTDPTPSVTATVTNQCTASGNTFQIKAVGTGGVAPYTYTINTGVTPSPADTFTVSPGSYVVTVTDANGCKNIASVTVSDPILASAVLTKGLTCPAVTPTDASITITVTGGKQPFGYRVKVDAGSYSGVPIPFTGTFFVYPTGTAGTYQFEITDANNCIKETNTVIVANPAPVTASAVSTNPTCNGDSDGTIRLTALTGVGPFKYSIDNGTTFVNSFIFGGLPAGSYPYIVRDSKGCEATNTVILANPAPISVFIKENGITCNSTEPGSLDINVISGGTAPYTYYLYDNAMTELATYTETSAAATPLHNFGGLFFGNYYIKVIDANGCKFESARLRIQPPPYLALTGAVAGATCADGVSVTVNVTGGNPNFVYSIYGIGTTSGPIAATSYTFTLLDQNTTYVFEVVDNGGCPSYLEIHTPTISPIVITPITVKNITCYNAANGEVSFTVPNYDATVTSLYYEIRDNLTNLPITPAKNGTVTGLTGTPFSASLTGLKPGNYTLYVKELDGTLCSTAETFQIMQPASALNSVITNVVPANCKSGALVTIKTTGGTGPYTYGAILAPGTIPTVFGTSNVLELAYDAATTNNWNIVVKDANGCEFPLGQIITLDPSPVIALQVVNKCVADGAYVVRVTATTAGTGAYSISVDSPNNYTSILGLPYDVTGLASGSHTIYIKDANQCVDSKTINIDAPISVVPAVTTLPTCIAVNGGVVTLTKSGGSATYSYSISPNPPSAVITGDVISGLPAGSYVVTITDTSSLCTSTAPFTLILPTPVDFDAVVLDASCFGSSTGSITVNLLPGNDNPVYTYAISPIPLGMVQTDNVFTNLPQGTYNITVTSGKGCPLTKPYIVGQPTNLVTTATVADFSCDPTNNTQQSAIVTVVLPTTGTAPYKYNFDGGSVYYDANTLSVDNNGAVQTIHYYVQDAHGCTFDDTIDVNPYLKLTDIAFNLTKAPVCPTNVADVTLIVSGGYTPYAKYEIISPILLDNGNSNVFTNLAPNSYLFKVTDAHGCSIERPYKVEKVIPIDITKTSSNNVSCNTANGTDNNGTATFTVSDFSATGNYTIAVTSVPAGLPFNAPTVATDVITVTGLVAGTYTVTVTDNTTNCSKSADVTITMPNPILFTATASKVFCSEDRSYITITNVTGGTAGYSYAAVKAGDPVPTTFVSNTVLEVDTNLTDLSWDVYVKDINGCISVKVNVPVVLDTAPDIIAPAQQCFVGADLTVDLDAISTTYNGVKSFTVNGLPSGAIATFSAAGTYKLGVKDDNGCEDFVNYIIQNQLIADATLTKDLYCVAPINATIDVKIAGGIAPYTYQMYLGGVATGLPVNTPGDFTASVPTAGSYYFVITDSNTPACSVTTNTEIVHATTPPTGTETHIDVTCAGGNNGSLTITPADGLVPYTFALTGPVVNTTGDVTGNYTGLIAGSYTIVITDKKGCISAGIPVVIAEPVKLTATHAIPANTTCSTATVITVTGHDGTPTGTGTGYYYNFNNLGYDTTNTFTVDNNGAIQTVTYTVKDVNGCETAPVTITINPLNSPKDLTFSPTAVTCLATSSNVTVTATDGVGALTFEIIEFNATPTVAYTPITTASSAVPAVFNGLVPGDYLFKVTDSNGCSWTELTTVFPVTKILVTAHGIVDMSCNTTNDGKATFDVSAFAGNYTYTITKDGAPFVASTTSSATSIPLTGLAFGVYEITVTDAVTGCPATYSVEVKQPDVVQVQLIENTNANCKTGAIVKVSAIGGRPDYTYAFVIAGSGSAGATFTDSGMRELNPATPSWDVYAKDANGCISAPFTVNITTDPLPAGFTASATSQCADIDGNYEIIVDATGGTGMGPFQYSIGSGFQSGTSFIVKTPKTYNLIVKDRFECTFEFTAAVTILQPLGLTNTIDALPSCANGDGKVTATATGGSGNYSYTIDGDATTTTTVTPAVFDNLNAGSHTIVVTDLTTLTCTEKVIFELGAATPVTGFDVVPTDVTCNGGNDGTLTASMFATTPGVNDNPKYMYSVNGGIPQENPVFTGLTAGTYTLSVISGRGCPDVKTVEIKEPFLIIVPNPAVVQYKCTTGNTGDYATITVTGVTGGSLTGAYIYEFIRDGNPVPAQKGTNNVYTELDLLGGSYTINVYDENGCVGSNVGPFVINPYMSLDKVDIVVTKAITCPVGEDITVSVKTTGGIPTPLNYSIAYSSGAPVVGNPDNQDGIFKDLGVEEYIITVTNPATGCSIQAIHRVYEPNTFEIKAIPVVSQVCFGTNDGSVNLTFVDNQTDPKDDSGIFDYIITGPVNIPLTRSANAGPVFVGGLLAGEYTVEATLVGSPFCKVGTVFSIGQPSAALTVTTTKSAITCIENNNDGEISASATGGWDNNYQYELVLNGATIAQNTDGNFTGLSAGNYTINVKDGQGCPASTTESLVIPDPIVVTASANVTVLSCFGDRSGIITVNPPTGGQGSNYMYTLNILSETPVVVSGPQKEPFFTGLPAGTYSITVTDGYSCSGTTTGSIVITDPSEVVPNLVLASTQTCTTQSTLTLSATGGSQPYTYSADKTFATTIGSFTTFVTFPVAVGKYQYYVKDANGCVATISNGVNIDPLEPLKVGLDVTNAVIKCLGQATGVIVANATGGLGNYMYTLENTTGGVIRIAQPEGRFEDLPIGTYIVRVASGDCPATSGPVEIKEPATAVQATFTPTNVSCFGENNGKIVVDAFGGTGIIKYAISPDLDQFDVKNTFDKLAPGKYTVVAQDENGCYVIDEVEITQPKPLIVTELANSMIPEVCKDDKDGAFSIEVRGGTAPYSVSLDDKKGTYTQGAVGQTIFDFTNLSGGIHTVYVNDAQGCSFEFVENMPLPVILDPTVEISYDCVNNAQSNMVTITIDQSNIDFTQIDYALDNDAGPFQAGNIFTNVAPGRHFIIARHTNGCKVPTISFDIKAYDPLTLAESAGEAEMNIISVTAAGGSPAYEYSFNGEPFTSSNKYKIYKSGDYVVVVRDQNGCTATITIPATYIDVCIDNYFTPNGDGVYDTWGPGCTNIYNNLEFSIFDRYGRVIAKYHYGQKWDGRYNGAELPSGDYWYVLKLNDEKDAREFVGHFTLYR